MYWAWIPGRRGKAAADPRFLCLLRLIAVWVAWLAPGQATPPTRLLQDHGRQAE